MRRPRWRGRRCPGRLRRALRLTLPLALALAAWVAALAVVAFEATVRVRRYPAARLTAVSTSWRIYARDGELLREAVNSEGHRARWVHHDAISPLVREATIAVEDMRFHRHNGIDPLGVLRAALTNLRAGRAVSGASTLTMQLARLVRPHPRTLWGKLGEMVQARRLERLLSKREILEQYLNRAYYGANAVGIEAASQRYFGVCNRHLSLAQAALLAGLPKAPSTLNPLRRPAAARRRQRHVLRRMLRTGRISSAQHRRALAEPLRFRRRPSRAAAMHFTDLLLARAREGTARGGALHTTLDLGLQQKLERQLADQLRALAGRGADHAAVVVLDNDRCAVRALVGSAGYWERPAGAVNGAVALRQPGSTLKPFTYALALERGMTPATALADVETRYGRAGGHLFVPRNFDGSFSGPVSLAEALGRSLNVPAVRVARRVGLPALLERLQLAGFASLSREARHYGLGLTLGNGEVTLLELAQGYAMLARGGRACRARLLRGEPQGPWPAVFSEQVSFLISDVLADESIRVAAFGPANALMLGFPLAVKTGTSSDWRDSWTVGYTRRHTVAVWVGNASGRSMNRLSGVSGAGPLFARVFRSVVAHAGRGQRPRRPHPPRGVEQVEVCARSGLRPTRHCRERRVVYVEARHRPRARCDWHRSIAIDRRNGLRAGRGCARRHVRHELFEVLPAEYSRWQARSGRVRPPARYSPSCPGPRGAGSALAVTYPRPGEVFLIEPGYDRRTQTVELRARVEHAVAAATWYVDGRRLTRARWPYSAAWQLEPGRHVLQVGVGGRRSPPVAITVR